MDATLSVVLLDMKLAVSSPKSTPTIFFSSSNKLVGMILTPYELICISFYCPTLASIESEAHKLTLHHLGESIYLYSQESFCLGPGDQLVARSFWDNFLRLVIKINESLSGNF